MTDTAATSTGSIWSHPRLLAGALGIFTYLGAEVAIGSLLVSFMGLPEIAGLRKARAADFVGGAIIPLATGKLVDIIGLKLAFLLPALCYVYIAWFVSLLLANSEKQRISPQ